MRGSLQTEEIVEFPVDRRGFLRRECAACHRQFKLRRSGADASIVLRRIMKSLPHVNEQEIRAAISQRICPYCAHRADGDEWWTDEQRVFLGRMAAAIGEEVRFEQLRHVERTLGQNPYLTFLPVAPAPFEGASRTESDDMRVMPLVCCGEEVKIRESWTGSIRCPFCGIEHATEPVQPPADPD
ncbi:hypothetical protein [Vulgatibacter incomptus]|uniref:Uncharacterized protein n=1 Tax=Vulgatibacter incomptus TaxID=1391653 RepID=A0A0K1PAL1_9BACT|nr:hypothetical protein [Vulgatibacter incomptus]AKU90555.1 hypothetical protein AKJ08_0942 [Vulgatibacter incomptus]